MIHARRLLEHLYKLAWSTRPEPRGHWRREVRAHRQELKANLTPSIRKQVKAALGQLHTEAADLAEDSFLSEEPAAARNRSLRWSLEQMLGEADDPLASPHVQP
jgi:hypothetical protein